MDDYIRKATKLTQEDIKTIEKKKTLPLPRSVSEVSMERMEEKALEAIAPRTGIPDLDRIIKGFIPGHLYTLTGVENVGKTSLACNFAVAIAEQNKKVLYFALEPENTVVEYIASVRTDKEFGDLTEEDIAYDDGNIHIYGKKSVSNVQDLVDIIEALERYDLIIIDHIGYFVTNVGNSVQEQSNIIKQLAGLTKSKQCAIMMIAHLRKRSPNQKKGYTPTSDDIAGSGAFKQDSTEVMIAVRNESDDNNSNTFSTIHNDSGLLYVTKTKCGPNGQVELIFTARKAKIRGKQREHIYDNLQNYYEGKKIDNDSVDDDDLSFF
jgi:replicative DNA helicase